MHVLGKAQRRAARCKQANLGVGLGAGKAQPVVQTLAVELDAVGVLLRLHPGKAAGLILEAAARLDDLERAGELGPDDPQNQRAVGGGRLLLRLDQLRETARRAQPDLDGVGLEVAILRLSRVVGHRGGLIADVFDFVDSARLGDGPAGGVVTGEAGAHGALPLGSSLFSGRRLIRDALIRRGLVALSLALAGAAVFQNGRRLESGWATVEPIANFVLAPSSGIRTRQLP